MKKIFVSLILMGVTIYSFSQDIIVLKTGDEIKSKVLEINTDQVKYKKWENIDGPTYTSLKSDVFMIKYQNGSKDVFKALETSNTNSAQVSSEDLKKNEAVKKLENYVRNRLSNQIIRVDGFRKTNGTMNNYFGQMIYTVNCDVDIRFISNGWKKGNSMEGYWSNFTFYSSEPNLSASGEQFMYATKFFQRGTFLTLGCIAMMQSTDNGFQISEFSVKTVTDRGVVPNNYQVNNSPNSVPEQKITKPAPPMPTLFKSTEVVVDVDGNTYHTVIIGKQTWMVENLKTTKYNDETEITCMNENLDWVNSILPGYCWYKSDEKNKRFYGALYNWEAVNSGKLAPKGWHIPTEKEFSEMIEYTKKTPTVKYDGMPTESIVLWIGLIDGIPIARLGGLRSKDGIFSNLGDYSIWWTSTSDSPDTAWASKLNSAEIKNSVYSKNSGFSVRCIKNN